MSENFSKKTIDELFDKMAAEWPSEFIARKKVEDYTGGMVTGKTVANFETRGEGPSEKIKFGRLSGYPKASFTEWLKGKAIVAEVRPVLRITSRQA